jgi:hypothetical protein
MSNIEHRLLHNQHPKSMRTLFLNTTYSIILLNNRDKSQLTFFGRQMFPYTGKYFINSYLDAVQTRKYGYLFVDHHSDQDNRFRVRNFIAPSFTDLKFYIPFKMGDNHTYSNVISVNKENFKEPTPSPQSDSIDDSAEPMVINTFNGFDLTFLI